VDTWKETIQGFPKTHIGERIFEALRKLKERMINFLRKEDSRIAMFTYNISKILKLWSLFFNNIRTILSLGRLLTWHKKTLNLLEWRS
jgi:hypothetical protein